MALALIAVVGAVSARFARRRLALPVLALTVVGLIPVWRYEPPSVTAGGAVTVPVEAGEPERSSETVESPGSAAPGGRSVVRGRAVPTEKGTVQVEVTFTGGEITAVRMLRQPGHPQTTATLDAQSADIDTVSGATVTSEGYRRSLQAAIDARE